jgi:o-succinylbenzoate---CoA ligase
VNRRLESTRSDVWGLVLPTFHVGGLGILARAHLSGAGVVSASWEPVQFAELCAKSRVTLCSLVPAQVVDLVDRGLKASEGLRAIVVGGGRLAERTRIDALALGWPVLPSYGATETASQVATAMTPGDPAMRLLSHVEASVTDGRLAFRGRSLLTGVAIETPEGDRWVDPRVGGWFVTEDRGEVIGDELRVEGRGGDFAKVGGESVDLARLDNVLGELSHRSALVVVPDRRLGQVLHLVSEEADAERIAGLYNERVAPFERVKGVHHLRSLPRTELGKLIRSRAAEEVKRILKELE